MIYFLTGFLIGLLMAANSAYIVPILALVGLFWWCKMIYIFRKELKL